ncbi:MAG TPA: hypothetical protein VKU62_09945, partial [Thermoanaerobaculia bacterium]|nr:hypothetical protein [Thermoanaerobaculia bacterium]
MKKLLVAFVAAYSIRVFAVCPAQPPQLIAPANGATNVASPVHFDWNDVPNANAYRVWASFNGGAANIIALTNDSQYDISVPAGPVDWWVDALGDSTCTTVATSQHFHFTAVGGTASCPQNPSSPTLTAPANGANSVSSPVTLSWTGVVGASGYRVFAAINGATPLDLGTTTFTQVSVPLPQGSVTWYVEAQFPSCPSTFSRFSTFTVTKGAACSTTPTTLVAPANGSTIQTTSAVTFQWNSVPGAAGY